MRLFIEQHQQIPGASTPAATIPLTIQGQIIPSRNTGRNLNLNFAVHLAASFPVTITTRILNDPARSVTVPALVDMYDLTQHRSLNLTNLSGTSTLRTCNLPTITSSSRSAASLAEIKPFHTNSFFHAGRNFFIGQGNGHTQITACFHPAP
jgi:hypothetical protein